MVRTIGVFRMFLQILSYNELCHRNALIIRKLTEYVLKLMHLGNELWFVIYMVII